MADETIVRLKITSLSRTPEQISEAIGMSCDASWHIGDSRPKTIIKEKDFGWKLNSELPRSASLEVQIITLLERILPFAEKIRLLSDCDVCCSCVVYAEHVPALYFTRAIIEKLDQIGAGLDVDLYIIKQNAD